MVRRVMKDAFVVWKNSRSIFGLTNYFAGQPRVAGAILSILFGLFLSACGGGGAGSPSNVNPITPPSNVTIDDDDDGDDDDPIVFPIFVDAPVQGLHYRTVGPVTLISLSQEGTVTLISRSQETGGPEIDGLDENALGGFDDQGKYGTIAFAVGEITVDGDGLTLSQYKSNGFLGFIVHPAGQWQSVVFTPYDLRTTLSDASVNTVSAGTVNVGAVARVLQGFDRTPPSTFPGGINDDDNLILIHPGATAERTVTFDQSESGHFSVQELESDDAVVVKYQDNYTIVISPAPKTENSPGYGGATLNFPLLANAMRTLSMVIADMADEIAPFTDNSTITLKNVEARTGYSARRGAYSLVSTGLASIDPNTGSLKQVTVTSGNPPEGDCEI